MNSQKTKELATAGARFPFGNFLSILKAWVQDINRASKDPSTSKIVTTGAGSTENLNRCKSVGFRNVVVQPSGIRKSKGP
jgi:hypothetical protein